MQPYQNIPITYITQEKQLGTGHALLTTKEFIKEDFLVLNGDDLYSYKDIQKITKQQNTMLLHELDDVSAFGVVSVDGKGKVTDIIEKPSKKPASNLINVGAFHFSKGVFSILKGLKLSKRGEYELTDLVKHLASKGQMHYIVSEQFWEPVGYPWHILSATKKILEHNQNLIRKGTVKAGAMVESEVSIDTGSVIEKGVRIMGLVTIGKNVTIKQNATIVGPTAISHGTVVGENSVIESSVIGKNSQVGNDCHLHHSVIGDAVIINDGINTEYNSPNKTISVKVKNKSVNTNLNQLGSFVADGSIVTKDTLPGQVIDQ